MKSLFIAVLGSTLLLALSLLSACSSRAPCSEAKGSSGDTWAVST